MAPALSSAEIGSLLQPFYPLPSALLLDQLATYLGLLLKWNEKKNLTSVRGAREMVTRHFGESLFLARQLPDSRTILDLGSGAGFPGVPVQLVHPGSRVVLAESQQGKAMFLREVVRALGLSTEVWSDRVEHMPKERLFDVVCLRAVDRPALALELARERVAAGGWIAHLTSGGTIGTQDIALPGRSRSFLRMFHVEHTSGGIPGTNPPPIL